MVVPKTYSPATSPLRRPTLMMAMFTRPRMLTFSEGKGSSPPSPVKPRTSPATAAACAAAGITFIGPKAETMRALGDKASARKVAIKAGVPVIPATEVLGDDMEAIAKEAEEIGYPMMLKASWGGGGRGMRPILKEAELEEKSVEIHMANPVCGDEIRLQLRIEGDEIAEAILAGQADQVDAVEASAPGAVAVNRLPGGAR